MWRARLINALVSRARYAAEKPVEPQPANDDAPAAPPRPRVRTPKYQWPHRTTTRKP
jgi:hypothetical protein